MALQLFTNTLLNTTTTILNNNSNPIENFNNKSIYKVDCYLGEEDGVKSFNWNNNCCCNQNEKRIIKSIKRLPLISLNDKNFEKKNNLKNNKDDIRIKYTSKHPYRTIINKFNNDNKLIKSIDQKYLNNRNYLDKLHFNKRKFRRKNHNKQLINTSSTSLKDESINNDKIINNRIDNQINDNYELDYNIDHNKQFNSLFTTAASFDQQTNLNTKTTSISETLFSSLPLFLTTATTSSFNGNKKHSLSVKQLSKRSPVHIDTLTSNKRSSNYDNNFKSTSSTYNNSTPISYDNSVSLNFGNSMTTLSNNYFNNFNEQNQTNLNELTRIENNRKNMNKSIDAFFTTNNVHLESRSSFKNENSFSYKLPKQSRLVRHQDNDFNKEDNVLTIKKLREHQNQTNHQHYDNKTEFIHDKLSLNEFNYSIIDNDNLSNDSLNDTSSSNSTFLGKSIRIPEFTVKNVLLLMLAFVLSLTTILGNMLVMISLIIDRQLRTISNYYLLSLSIADFTIGLISMPLYSIYLFLGEWPLNRYICDAWLSLDYLMSNASVLNLLVISFDRYFSVTRPLTYRLKRTTKRAFCWMLSTYLISSILWPPWIIYYPIYEGRTVPENECYIQFLQTSPGITFFTAIVAFYIPVLLMIYLNWKIWRETQQRYKDITTLFLVSTAGGKVIKNGKSSKEFDSQRSTTMTVSGAANQTASIATLSRNNTLTSCEEGTKGINGKINNRQSSLKKKQERNFWQRFCTFNESMQSQSTTANEIVQDTEITTQVTNQRAGVKRSLHANKTESLKETDDELENQLRAHVLTDNETKDNELKNEIGTKQMPSSDSEYKILIHLQEANSDTGISIKMIESQNNSINNNEFTQADANNNQDDESKPLTIANDHLPIDNSKCLHINSALSQQPTNMKSNGNNYSTTSIKQHHSPINTQQADQDTNPDVNSNSKISGSNIGGNSTAGHYVPQQPKSERKAAKTLSAILFAFIITWTPYNVLALLRSSLSDKGRDTELIPKTLWLFCYYLCYINSTVNPVCYALCNAAFRRTYIRILKCKWTKSKRTVASQRYQQDENRRLQDFKNNKYRHWMT